MDKKPDDFKTFFEPFVRNYEASLSTYILQENSENKYSKQIVTKDIMKTMYTVMQDLRKSLHNPEFGCPFPPDVVDFYMLRMAEYIFKGKVSKNSSEEFSTKLTRRDGRSYEDFQNLMDHIAHEVKHDMSGKLDLALQEGNTDMLEETLQNLVGDSADVSVKVINADELPEDFMPEGYDGKLHLETKEDVERLLRAIFNHPEDTGDIEEDAGEPTNNNEAIQNFLEASKNGDGLRGFVKSDEGPKLPKRFRLKRKDPNSEGLKDGDGN